MGEFVTGISTKLLATAAITGAVVSFTALPNTPAKAKELKIATFMSPKHYLNRVAFKKLAEDIGKATGSSTAKVQAAN